VIVVYPKKKKKGEEKKKKKKKGGGRGEERPQNSRLPPFSLWNLRLFYWERGVPEKKGKKKKKEREGKIRIADGGRVVGCCCPTFYCGEGGKKVKNGDGRRRSCDSFKVNCISTLQRMTREGRKRKRERRGCPAVVINQIYPPS